VEYVDFCRLIQKDTVVTLVISGITEPVISELAHVVGKLLPFNIFESELPYCKLYRNASLPNEGHFDNLARN